MKYILAFLGALTLAYLLTPLFRSLARRLNIMDVPDGIKAHKKPVPYLGGAAIYLAFLISLIAVAVLSPHLNPLPLGGEGKGEGGILIGVAAVSPYVTPHLNPLPLGGEGKGERVESKGEGVESEGVEGEGVEGEEVEGEEEVIQGGYGAIHGSKRGVAALLTGGTVIALLGLIDDIKRLSFYVKFVVQVLAAIILILGGIRLSIEILPLSLNMLFTVIWVVAITNAFNIIDVMDGLSSGVAFVSAVIFLVIALLTHEPQVALIAAALAGGTLGFLGYNFQPATIFMGDMGSGFVGFILAAIAMGESYTGRNSLALFSPILILGIPIYDTILVSVLRIRRGKPIFKGSPDHFALRLLAMGFSVRRTVFFAYSISLCLGIMTFIIIKVIIWWALVLLVLLAILSLLAARRLSSVEMKDSQ